MRFLWAGGLAPEGLENSPEGHAGEVGDDADVGLLPGEQAEEALVGRDED